MGSPIRAGVRWSSLTSDRWKEGSGNPQLHRHHRIFAIRYGTASPWDILGLVGTRETSFEHSAVPWKSTCWSSFQIVAPGSNYETLLAPIAVDRHELFVECRARRETALIG